MLNNYHNLLEDVLINGVAKQDRTGVGTYHVFGPQLTFDLKSGFPLLTTKKVHWKSVVEELLWIIRGDSNIRSLQSNGVTIWNEWADANGDLGPVYGVQWRHWGGDQLKKVIDGIKNDPSSRRLIVSAWNADEISKMALAPCHMMYQFNVINGYLDCLLMQRSADLFLGLPFNIASYALLTSMVAQVTGCKPNKLIVNIGDAHIYSNHVEQVKELLSRTHFPPPTLSLNKEIDCIDKFTFKDIFINNYSHHPAIKAPVAV